VVVEGFVAVQSDEVIDPFQYVSREFEPFFPILRQSATLPPFDDSNLAERRKPSPMFTQPPLASPAILERTIPGPQGAPDVKVYVVNAGEPGAAKPAILHFHGGGFVALAAENSLRALQEHAEAIECVIVTVDYRLAPETAFPGALEDNYAALKWLYAHAAELGVDRDRIALMGESAGGGHAAMLAIAARDRGEVPLMFQALTYPMLDDRTGSSRQAPAHVGQLLWTATNNRFGWSALLGMPAGSPNVPAGSVPARVEDLSGLPPAFIAVGSIDIFVEEDIEYARRLLELGIPAELHVYPGAFHGFNLFPSETTRQFTEALRTALKNAFAFAKA